MIDQNDLLRADALPDDPTEDCAPHVALSVSPSRSASRQNAIDILETDARWAGKLWFNLFDQRIWLADRKLDDHALTDLVVDMSRAAGAEFTPERVHQAVSYVARRRRRHAVAEYLRAQRWDGTARLDQLLPHYFGAENDPFTALLGRKWAISVVSRALKPGNKVDTTLLLVGKQGIGKSRAIRTLAVRPEWFNDTSLDIGSRDGRLALLGTWLMELGELDSLKRSQLSAIKAFLTDQEDRYRMPYGRMEITVPRSCVFVGTTNERVMLRDSTGNRRFWPVEVTSIDIDGLKRDRDQLWAEAVVRHDDGEPWWLDGAESKELARRAEAFTQGDSWTELLEVWLDGRETFTTAEALEGAVGIAPARQSRPDTLRMTGLLTDLGFRSCRRKRPDGTRPRVWTLEPS